MKVRIWINDLLPSKAKQKRHFNANNLSSAESVVNRFHFPSSNGVDAGNKNVGLRKGIEFELHHNANIFSIWDGHW